MIKNKGLRSVLMPALVAACLVVPAQREARAFVVDTSSLLAGPIVQEDSFTPGPDRYLAFAVRMRGLGNHKEAKEALLDIRRAYQGTPWEKRASLLLGLIAFDEGSPGAPGLLEDAAGIEAIDDHIVFFQAEALMQQGRFVEAAGAFGFILSSYPSTTLREEASFSYALATLKSGDAAEASAAFRRFLDDWPRSKHVPEANLRLAESFISQGLAPEALHPLKELSTAYPASRFAAESDFFLANLDFGPSLSGAFSAQERFRRSENFFVTANYTKALSGYATLFDEPEFRDRALFRTAIATARLKRYRESEKALREYLSIKGADREAEALYWLALVSARQGRHEGVAEAQKRLSKDHRQSGERAKVLMLVAGMKAGKSSEEAAEAYRAVIDEFAGSNLSDEAFWRIGWEAYTSGRIDEAFEAFSIYLETRPGGRLSAQAMYWKARAAERLGRAQEAATMFARVCAGSPQSFYCLMSSLRQKAVPLEASEDVAADAPVDGPFSADPAYLAARELMLLGLASQASSEIDILARKHARDKPSLSALAGLLYEAEDFYRAFRIYRQHLSASNERAHLWLAYPPRLVKSVREKAAREAADPCLVAAVMREESHFNPEAVSPVGAMGLMQIMPSTGKQIARELGEGMGGRGLLDPARSIKFGSWYLGQLMKRFEGDVVLAIAGYNAGPNAAARWAQSLPRETDEFVESIPYEETRGYVKKVLSSYAGFLRAAGEDFIGKVARPPLVEEAMVEDSVDAVDPAF